MMIRKCIINKNYETYINFVHYLQLIPVRLKNIINKILIK